MITVNKNICSGSPVVEGTRICVIVILANIRDGVSFSEICKDYNITEKDIRDCIDYAIKRCI